MSEEAKKENYAIMLSGFGNYWVGKTLREVDNKSIFSTFDEATEEAIELTDSVENTDELECEDEQDCEMIRPEMEKWIIN